ncbi:DUF6894 family protein [Sphingomonas phyllosphaerae]|uniref:DUF6894 family protein n=1 Tax=Sphingomonas phyllosphaerae TaxID=257003 RepID=UPI00048A7DA7|nr:hypothetical protein [Sphingomonas phyllosphaerae]
MMRYFFHSETDNRSTDGEGVELDTPEQARREGIQMCAQMMHDAPKSFWGSRPWSVTITDEAGLVLWNINIDASESAAGLSLR